MPIVNPETGEPMSDAPETTPEQRGGKQMGDPGMEGTTETGGQAAVNRPQGGPDDSSRTQLPAEKPSGK
jgi:hypothetical protein